MLTITSHGSIKAHGHEYLGFEQFDTPVTPDITPLSRSGCLMELSSQGVCEDNNQQLWKTQHETD